MKAHLLAVLSLTGCAVDTDTTEVTQHAQAQTILLPAAGTGQNREVMSSFDPLVVTLYDTFGNPLGGQMITFTSPAAGASSTFHFDGMAETDSEGNAQLRPYANQWAGTYRVWAHADGAEPMPFVLTNSAAAPGMMEPILGTNQYSGFGMPFEQPLTIAVRDNYGNPVEGAPVEFVAPTEGPTARMLDNGITVTDEDGHASTFAVAGEQPGTYAVQAKVAGAPAVSFVLSNMDMTDTSWRLGVAQRAAGNTFTQSITH